MTQSTGYAAREAGAPLAPFAFERRDPKPHDVTLEITHCGICHSDVHSVDDDLGFTRFPIVPGHEIIGTVVAIGPEVTRFRVGDTAAIGCYTDSCRVCPSCRADKQNMCEEGFTGTFGGFERDGKQATFGGFSNNYVANEDYVLKVPTSLDRAAAAPLLCAGITVWAPLTRFQVGPGKQVGIVGLGGLGHMAVKFAVALGAEVTVFTTTPGKAADAKALGAHRTVISTDAKAMRAEAGRFDFILDTVSASHDINGYIVALKREATLCLLGIAPGGLNISNVSVIFGQKCVVGSLIGGLKETQEMLDFCGERDITADIELIAPDAINTAFERLKRNDVRYRFVIDMQAA